MLQKDSELKELIFTLTLTDLEPSIDLPDRYHTYFVDLKTDRMSSLEFMVTPIVHGDN